MFTFQLVLHVERPGEVLDFRSVHEGIITPSRDRMEDWEDESLRLGAGRVGEMEQVPGVPLYPFGGVGGPIEKAQRRNGKAEYGRPPGGSENGPLLLFGNDTGRPAFHPRRGESFTDGQKRVGAGKG